MWRDSPLRRATSVVLGICFLFQVSGCTGWATQQAPPGDVLAKGKVEAVRVTRTDGTRLVVFEPTIASDTLRGFLSQAAPDNRPQALPTAAPADTSDARPAVAVALADIHRMEVHSGSGPTTVLLVAGVVVLLVGVLVMSSDWFDLHLGNWSE